MAASATNEPLVNAERQDLAVPLPSSWDLAALRALPVTLYGNKISPPCCKLRFLLQYFDVPFSSQEGKKPNSEYKKIPVLDIGDRQINDSYIIVKTLAPILQGRELTPRELKIEEILTFEIMIALERDCASSTRSLCGCGSLLGGLKGFALSSMAPAIAVCVAPRIGKDKNLQEVGAYGDYLKMELGSSPFFGGAEPGITDASIYGVLLPFEAVGAECVTSLMGASPNPLRAWYDRMAEKARGTNIF
mmetsp:Transcript_4018/g.11771  ORF Transcript_4018/g.11771 Transcript_4018/m.11771 type:complete len:247 (+) Transcript_4018:86-826(+)